MSLIPPIAIALSECQYLTKMVLIIKESYELMKLKCEQRPIDNWIQQL